MTISKEMAFYIKENANADVTINAFKSWRNVFSDCSISSSDVMILSQKSRQKFNWIFYSKKQLEYFDEVLFVYH